MNNNTFEVFDSVTKIPRVQWDKFFKDIPEGYDFFKTLEESGLEQFTFRYAALRKNDLVMLIAPLFIADFNLDIAVEGWLEKAIGLIRKVFPRFLILKTLFIGSPFGEHGILGIDQEEGLQEAVDGLVSNLIKYSRENKASLIIFKDFPEEKLIILSQLLKKGFFKLNSFPTCVNEVKFNSFEEYLKSLGSSTRKSLRRKLKDAHSRAKITIQTVDSNDEKLEEIYNLYLSTHNSGGTKFEKLTKYFFVNILKNMQGRAKIFLYYVDGKLGAFNLCFIFDDLFIDKFIGFNYDVSRRHNLYYLSYCYNIEWCIKNSISYYQTGQTDYQAKVRLGGRLRPLYVYLKHNNKLNNILLKALSKILKPDNFDSDIKDMECLRKE